VQEAGDMDGARKWLLESKELDREVAMLKQGEILRPPGPCCPLGR